MITIFDNIAFIFWIDPGLLKLIFMLFYFLPIFIQSSYRRFTRWLFFTTLFLWRTPLPRIILILNIIEENEGQNELYDKLDLILENQKRQEKLINKIENYLFKNDQSKIQKLIKDEIEKASDEFIKENLKLSFYFII